MSAAGGWVSTPDLDISFQHCGRPAYWEGDEVFCNKCNEQLPPEVVPPAVEFAAAICVDCLIWHQGTWEGEGAAENERGAGFMSRIESAEVWTYMGLPEPLEPHFSWDSCDGCGSHLGGDRFDVEILQEPRK
jgi:hypothetical protein